MFVPCLMHGCRLLSLLYLIVPPWTIHLYQSHSDSNTRVTVRSHPCNTKEGAVIPLLLLIYFAFLAFYRSEASGKRKQWNDSDSENVTQSGFLQQPLREHTVSLELISHRGTGKCISWLVCIEEMDFEKISQNCPSNMAIALLG